MAIVIGSFNMYKFSYQRTDEIKKDLNMISKIIKTEKFGVVALQEVFNKGVVKDLICYLGSNWSYAWDQPRSRSNQAAEGYAFIWNTDIIDLAPTNDKLYNKVKPMIYQQYRIDKKLGQIRLSRDPFYARFTPKNNLRVEIRLINTHIRYTKDKEADIGEIRQRRNEYNVLIKSILESISNKRYGNNYVPYTVLLGDYNLSLTGSDRCEEYVAVHYGNKSCYARTVQDKLTTINKNNDGYSSNYDHFSYNEGNFEGVRARWSRVDAVAKYYGNDFEQYKKRVSDHLPIKLFVNLKDEG